jgi:hypothetical protein
MPVRINTKTFTDQFGTTNPFFRVNSGDRVVATLRLFNNIYVQSGANVFLQLDPIQNIITWQGGDFEREGFRIGQSVTFTIYSSGGSPINTWNTSVQNVNGNQLDVASVPFWINQSNGELVSILALPVSSNNWCLRESGIIQPNLVQNLQTGSEFSLIDGESSRFFFDFTQLNGSNTISGVPVGNQSGNMIISCSITDQTLAIAGSIGSPTRVWDLEIEFVHSGILLESFFSTSNCLKFYTKMDFSVFENEPFDQFTLIYNDDADSGWFDEAFNNGILNATLIDSINEIAFDQPTDVQFIVDAPISGDFGFGFSYIPQDITYYKNRLESQLNLSIVAPTTEMNVGDFVESAINPFGAMMRMDVLSIVQSGTQQTIQLRFTPNSDFADFMDQRDPDDRLFYVWARFGNVNLLVFNNQMLANPPIGGELTMQTHLFVDHSQNIDDATGTIFGYESDIEDDLMFIGKFQIPFGSFCDSFVAKIQAWNDITGETFDLQSVFFDISTIPVVSGKHIINVSQPVINSLPTTSLKRNSVLVLDPSNDDVGVAYGVKIVFPFLNRWEYWLEQLNASNIFYPNNQTKNWFPYDSTPDWNLRLRLELIQNELLYFFNDPQLLLKNYDSNMNIDSSIELFIESTNQNVQIITEGEMMRVVGKHELVNGELWDSNVTWGMITIEPTESSPRFICSSVVPFDNNSLNPLIPLNALLCSLTFPTPTIAKLECLFDPNKINLTNGAKFTSKIKGCSIKSILAKQKTDGTFKLKTDGSIKLKTDN